MEIHTDMAAKASSSSGLQMQMQLKEQEEQINFIQRKTDKLSENPYQEIETHKQFINKAKQEINYFTQLIREFLKGSLKIESIAPFDVEILDIHWNRTNFVDVIDTNDAVIYINLDIDIDEETILEGEFEDLIRKSIRTVRLLIESDDYPSLHDDLKALEEEQYNWLMLDMGISSDLDISSESDSDSEDKMEIHTGTAVKASSSSGMQMQLKEQEEQINFIQRKTDKLSITENPYQEIETHKQFINKAKQEINYFTQLIREFLKGSLKIESIAPFDVEILDIHWNRTNFVDVIDTNDAVIYINLDIDIDEETILEGEFEDLIRKSIRTVRLLIESDDYPSLHDDLKALEEEQYNWLMLDMGISSDLDISFESDSDSEDKMEIHTGTAVKASSSSGMQMQLNEQEEQINFIQRKTDKLSIAENPYQEIETHKQFINKTKKEINYFTQLIREFLKGSLNIESITPFDVEILDIHWNRLTILHLTDTNDAVTYIYLDMDEETLLEGKFKDLIRKSMQTVRRLIMSDEYPSLHDDLKALQKEQYNWLMHDYDDHFGISSDLDISSESDSDSEDKGMMLD